MKISDFTVKDNRKEVKAELNEKLIRALNAIGMQAEAYTKQEITGMGLVDTGRMRNSITYEVIESEDAVYIGTNVEYAAYQEFGTSTGIPPHHFLKKAATEHNGTYAQIAKNYLKGE